MKSKICKQAKVVSLPWSNGTMSAKVWHRGGKTIACVPELGLHCYGKSESEASFRLFTVLLKYYRQLRVHRNRIGKRGQGHLELLSDWMTGIENRMRLRTVESDLVTTGSHRFD
jgi:hypothetical protein